MADDAGEKKHEPGERKWREAAEKGELPKSADINAAAVVIFGAAALVFAPGPLVRAVSDVSLRLFSANAELFDLASAHGLLLGCLVAVATGAAAPLLVAMVASSFASAAQTNLQLAPKALEPKWERLDVVSGFKNMYLSWTPLVEFAKGSAKILVIGAAVALSLRGRVEALPKLAAQSPQEQLTALVDLGWSAIVAATPVILVVAAVDYAATWYRTNEQLKRTDREVKDEAKEQEGDPQLKAQRRARARKIAMSVNLQAVRTADVVVTNPTHFAIALRYRRTEDAAPVVLAKGLDHLALRIRAEALRANVPRIEDRALARALFKRCDVGTAIPEDLFAPVAKVLAVVYRRRQADQSRR